MPRRRPGSPWCPGRRCRAPCACPGTSSVAPRPWHRISERICASSKGSARGRSRCPRWRPARAECSASSTAPRSSGQRPLEGRTTAASGCSPRSRPRPSRVLDGRGSPCRRARRGRRSAAPRPRVRSSSRRLRVRSSALRMYWLPARSRKKSLLRSRLRREELAASLGMARSSSSSTARPRPSRISLHPPRRRRARARRGRARPAGCGTAPRESAARARFPPRGAPPRPPRAASAAATMLKRAFDQRVGERHGAGHVVVAAAVGDPAPEDTRLARVARVRVEHDGLRRRRAEVDADGVPHAVTPLSALLLDHLEVGLERFLMFAAEK